MQPSVGVVALPERLRRAAVQYVRTSPGILRGSYRLWRQTPVERWPSFLAKLYTIGLPSAVQVRSTASASGDSNINILLEFLEETRGIEGDIAECGVFKGGSIIPMGLYLRQHQIPKHILGFDSFGGFDESVAVDLALGGAQDPQKRVGGFNDTSYERLQEKIEFFELTSTVQLVKGYFRDTLERFADRQFSFVHLDCDIYQSYKDCLEFFYPRVPPGGVILFDEYNDPPWPGCKKAVDEFLADKPERPLEVTRDSYQKWFIRKACVE